jgi:arginine-tRNA-protein transferase
VLEISEEKIGGEEPCPYLPSEVSKMRYRVISGCTAATYEGLLIHGWRRFGRVFFRPICAACQECRGMRVEVAGFRRSRSMRRTWKRNRDVQILLRRPSLSQAHLDLYSRYHADMAERRGWPNKSVSAHEYHYTFVDSFQSFGWELLFLLRQRLVAVALVDILPHSLSAVYSY